MWHWHLTKYFWGKKDIMETKKDTIFLSVHDVTVGNLVRLPGYRYWPPFTCRFFSSLSDLWNAACHLTGNGNVTFAFDHLNKMVQFVDVTLNMSRGEWPVHWRPEIYLTQYKIIGEKVMKLLFPFLKWSKTWFNQLDACYQLNNQLLVNSKSSLNPY